MSLMHLNHALIDIASLFYVCNVPCKNACYHNFLVMVVVLLDFVILEKSYSFHRTYIVTLNWLACETNY